MLSLGVNQRQCVCPCTLVRLGEIRQANIVRSLVDRQRSPPPPEARSIDRRPVFPLPSEQWPGRSMSSATLRRHQFSRSVRNISDNNCIYQLFGASIRHLAQSNPPTRPKGQHRHGRSDLSLQRRPASGRGTRGATCPCPGPVCRLRAVRTARAVRRGEPLASFT